MFYAGPIVPILTPAPAVHVPAVHVPTVCGDRHHHFFLLRLRGSRTAAAAFRVHSVLPWYPDTMVRWKRAVAIRDPFRVVSPPGLKALSANRLALNWSRYRYLCLRDSLTGTTPLPDVNGNAEHEHDRPIQHRLCAAPIEGEDSKDEGDHLDRA